MSKIPRTGSRLQLSNANAIKVTPDTESDCGLNDLSEGIPIAATRQAAAGRLFRDDSLGAPRRSSIPALISRWNLSSRR